ncbi:hypothetical protein BpHYR1_022567 [Brachionus plicatilis]|uniref:Uncharacterized protein n=1 Tax=Brachionus plicatilis TaxID=10195 RepID=A0A3M7QGJ5_BRAPC|nr:hypothetical protein BpHYR1_022567 [Brachionus plicatilis]
MKTGCSFGEKECGTMSVRAKTREVVPVCSRRAVGKLDKKAFFVTPDCVGWAVAGDGRHKSAYNFF